MLEPPFDIISCSWPRPIEHANDQWTSEPEWDAPLMPTLPQPHWDLLNDELCWTIDWRRLFKQGLVWWDRNTGGEMRGFHIVFRLRINASGTLVFWADDGCIIRRNGIIVHNDRNAHPLYRSEIEVHVGDFLEVAQWQRYGEWLWGARLRRTDGSSLSPVDALIPYLQQVQRRLNHPEGPPLKVYTSGRTPIRAIVAIYSLVLNGYVPSAVHLFGDYQWNEWARHLFATLLPFAQVIPTNQVISRVQTLGGLKLVDMARRYWFVMKTCVSLLYPPETFCLMDDDVFILDRVDDALDAFQKNDLVFIPDQDLYAGFVRTWGTQAGSANMKRFNGGLYWLRQVHDPRWVAPQTFRGRLNPNEPYHWEQGFFAIMYAHKNTVELPGQRYFYPLFDGLPGGMLGYDYKLNPCGFKSIHFGGLFEKPSDGVTLHLVPQLLGRYQTITSQDHVVIAR